MSHGDKKEWAKYMRQYTRENRERINAQRNKRNAIRSKTDPSFRKMANERNKKWYEKHKEEINARAKARNWNYNPIKRKEIRKRYAGKYPARTIIHACRKRAEKYGLPFNLTEEWYYDHFDKCAVTSMPLDIPGSRSPWTAHVDRINPNEGYTMKNCRLVCAMYNLAKKNWADKDVIQMAYALIRTSDA